MKRRYKILAVLLAVVVIGFLLLPSDNPRRAVEAYKQQLRAKGEKLTMVELAPPTSSNGIIAGKAFTNAMANYKLPSDYPSPMKIITPGVAMVVHSNLTPAEMASYASNSAKAAELRGILNVPRLDFDLDYSRGSDIQLLHLAKLKSAGLLFSVTALQELHQQDYAEAWSNLIASVSILRLDDSPFMISDLVRVAMGRVAAATSWEALQENRWTDAQLADLQARWESLDFLKQSEASMVMERAEMIDYLAKMRKQKDGASIIAMAAIFGTPAAETSGGGVVAEMRDDLKKMYDRYPRFWMWKASWSYDEELEYIQITSAARKAAGQARSTGVIFPALKEFQQQATNLVTLNSNKANHFMLLDSWPEGGEDVYVKYFKKIADVECARRLLVAAIALKRFQLQHHAYPASLTELVPDWLKQAPMDPWDGQPQRYRLKPEGDFLLYSVGHDGQDNGGDASPVETIRMFDWTGARDVVWPRAATPAEAAAYNSGQLVVTNAVGK